MSNGNLIRDLKKANKVNNKSNSIKNSNNTNNSKKGLKNSTSNDTLSNRTSAANPFVFEKKKETWLTEEGQLYLESWANDGLNNQEIAKKMGVCEDTFYRWCNEEPRIKGAVIRGRDTSTMAVENMLYKCAMGFKYTEQQVTKDGDIVEEAQVEAQTTIKVSEADKLADSLFGNEDDPDETVEETESIPNV